MFSLFGAIFLRECIKKALHYWCVYISTYTVNPFTEAQTRLKGKANKILTLSLSIVN